jgi:DNA-binding NtrC family response regulator
MPDDLTTAQAEPKGPLVGTEPLEMALALAFSVHEPHRMGEVAFLDPRQPLVLGRAGTLRWMVHRPETRLPTGPLDDPLLSREQLVLRTSSDQVSLQRVGRLPVKVNGIPIEQGEAEEGDVIEIGDRMVLVVHSRPLALEGERPDFPFGQADPQGFVGEGPVAWALREQLSFLARRSAHVLVSGESGTGKELAARALHELSSRARRPLVSRSAATIPESLADAELFGNLGNYPNPGMAARPGLIGEADGGTLFLDEFGELPIEVQARLLRVLDAGEYTRLGEAKSRKADLRFVAATNRAPDALKHDVLARLPLRMHMPSLPERREDIPLLAVHLLRGIAQEDREVARRCFGQGDPRGWPRLTARLVAALVSHPYRTHVRELLALLWRAIGETRGEELDLFPSYSEMVSAPLEHPLGATDPSQLAPEVIQAALDRHGGRQELAWRELGLSSRHVLARLVKKYDLKVRGRGP